jgi:hypothetical protein
MPKMFMLIVILAVGYIVGVKFPGPANNLGL